MPTAEELYNQAVENSEKAEKSWKKLERYSAKQAEAITNTLVDAARTLGVTAKAEDVRTWAEEFRDQPIITMPKGKNEIWLWAPKFVPLEFGFLYGQDGPWNLFIVNKYSALIQEVPTILEDVLDLSTPFNGIVVDEFEGTLQIERPDVDDARDVKSRYDKYLTKIKDDSTILVKKGMEFEIQAALLRDGILPYKSRPIPDGLFRDTEPKFELRDYQQRDWNIFLETSAIGVFYPMGTGKSFLIMRAIQVLKGKKLIMVPNGTLARQWYDYVLEYTTLEEGDVSFENKDIGKVEVSIVIYNKANIKKVTGIDWVFIGFDEVSTLVADTHLQFLTKTKAKTRIFATATPMREDGREDLIFASCGRPLGVDWKYFLENDLIKQPKIDIWVEEDKEAKMTKMDELIDDDKRTIIFCDGISLGKKISKKYGVKFIYGKTPKGDRMRLIHQSLDEHNLVVVSRIGDLGISMKFIDVILEIDYNKGSRQQETQRVGRLFHSEEEGQYHAIMTARDYYKHKKRFLGLWAKRIDYDVTFSDDLPDDLSSYISKRKRKKRKRRSKRKEVPDSRKLEDTSKYAMLDDRDPLDDDMIKAVLSSDLAKEHNGLKMEQIQDNLRFCEIKGAGTRKARRLVYRMYDARKISRRRDSDGRHRYYVPD